MTIEPDSRFGRREKAVTSYNNDPRSFGSHKPQKQRRIKFAEIERLNYNLNLFATNFLLFLLLHFVAIGSGRN